jgi:Fe-S-cluster-containing hydrogenase component 2
MDMAYCVESCPTHALMLIDPEDIARGRFKLPKKGSLVGLNFTSGLGLSKHDK